MISLEKLWKKTIYYGGYGTVYLGLRVEDSSIVWALSCGAFESVGLSLGI